MTGGTEVIVPQAMSFGNVNQVPVVGEQGQKQRILCAGFALGLEG